jgi:hypothetical protein
MAEILCEPTIQWHPCWISLSITPGIEGLTLPRFDDETGAISDLDLQFLRWGYSKTLLQHLAHALLEGSEAKQQEGCDLFDCIIEAGVKLGLVIAE